MLDKLYRKLHTIFIFGIMLIISTVIGIVCLMQIRIDNSNDISLFQRMATLIIYRLENYDEDFDSVIKEYEKDGIFCSVQDTSGDTVYLSDLVFPTTTDSLIASLNQQMASTSITDIFPEQEITTQNGIFEIKGENRDLYLGIPASVVANDHTVYKLLLLYKAKTTADFLSQKIFFYLLIWVVSFIFVVIFSALILKKALEPTEKTIKSQKDFIASASHELKSPLAVILANIEKLNVDTISKNEIEQSVRVMDFECMRMSQLIRDMLLLASTDAKSWNITKEYIDIDTMLISLYEAYEPVCTKENISLFLNIEEKSFPELFSDKDRIVQILGIFMDNAIHHSDGSPKIEILTEVNIKNITFYIVDHGKGVSEQDKPFIFDRFFCADKSHTNKSHFGLGLSIAAEMAKILGGKIGYKDTYKGGATFYLTIPLK